VDGGLTAAGGRNHRAPPMVAPTTSNGAIGRCSYGAPTTPFAQVLTNPCAATHHHKLPVVKNTHANSTPPIATERSQKV
jgi:hypothetical protein